MDENKTEFQEVLEAGIAVDKEGLKITKFVKTAADVTHKSVKLVEDLKLSDGLGSGAFGKSVAFSLADKYSSNGLSQFSKFSDALKEPLASISIGFTIFDAVDKGINRKLGVLDVATAGLDVLSSATTIVGDALDLSPGVGQIVSGTLDAASSFIKMGQEIAKGIDADGKKIAGHALNGAAGLLTVAAGICTLIPGAQVAVPFLLLASGICKLASLITANWDAVVGFFKDAGSWIANKFKQGVQDAKAFITQGIETAKALLKVGQDLAVKALKGAIRAAVAVWNQILGTAVKALKMAVGIAVGAIKLGIAALKLTLAIGAAALKFGKALADAVKNWLKDIFKKKIDIAKDAQKWWKKIFKSIEKAVKRAMKEAEERDYSFVTIRYGEVRMFAGGGLPASGLPFVAREAGPELVGRLNGHTAVVNNHQIVEAVSRGVYGAFRSALCDSHSKSQAKAYVYLDGKQIAMAGQA